MDAREVLYALASRLGPDLKRLPMDQTSRRNGILFSTSNSRRTRLACVALLALLPASRAVAQVGDEIPHNTYYLASHMIYSGEYRDAERGLRRETQRGVRTSQARWID